MQIDDEGRDYVTVEHLDTALDILRKVVRPIGYFVCSYLLLQASPWQNEGDWRVALVIGILGLASSSARIGQLGIAILLILASMPPALFDRLSG